MKNNFTFNKIWLKLFNTSCIIWIFVNKISEITTSKGEKPNMFNNWLSGG